MGHHHHKECPHARSDAALQRKAAALDVPTRHEACPPQALLALLPLQERDNVLDLGAGTGYLALPAAQATTGAVIALDSDPGMLALLAEKAQQQGLANLCTREGSMEAVPLEDGTVQVALASLALHEVPHLAAALAEAARVLAPGGRLLCVEYEPAEDPSAPGPLAPLRISSHTLSGALAKVGLRTQKTVAFPGGVYVLVAQREG